MRTSCSSAAISSSFVSTTLRDPFLERRHLGVAHRRLHDGRVAAAFRGAVRTYSSRSARGRHLRRLTLGRRGRLQRAETEAFLRRLLFLCVLCVLGVLGVLG